MKKMSTQKTLQQHLKKLVAQSSYKYFFSAGAMRFFSSKLEYVDPDLKLFITSEKTPDEPRKYTLRIFIDDQIIDICQRLTLAEAKKVLLEEKE